MDNETVLDHFRQAGALLEGHFLYTSGRHGNQFIQAARVLQYPNHTEALCAAMADLFRDDNIELVAGPATGGIILAYETARQLGVRGAFTEKDESGDQIFGRGFKLDQGTRVLMVEDVTTTGGSVKKSIEHLRSRGADIVGVSVLIDRSGGEATFDCPFRPLARLTLESWEPDQCPLCAAGTPVVEPDTLQV